MTTNAIKFATYLSEKTNLRYEDVMTIFGLLRDTNSVIAGSSVLAFMRADAGLSTFVPNDIDVFTNDPDFMNLLSQQLGNTVTYHTSDHRAEYGSVPSMKVYSVMKPYDPTISNKSLSERVEFQVILLEKPVMEAVANFDIDICSKSFDGTSFYSKVPVENNQFNVTRRMNTHHDVEKCTYRCVKYMDRRFELGNVYISDTPPVHVIQFINEFFRAKENGLPDSSYRQTLSIIGKKFVDAVERG